MKVVIIETERLILRMWKKKDIEPFVRLNMDPEVMKYFPTILSKEQSTTFVKKIRKEFRENGWGLWVVQIKNAAEFIGFIGLMRVSFVSHFTPNVEIGWRLDPLYWGKGYATEGAKAILEYGFKHSHLEEIVSFTSIHNKPSIRVMEKLSMIRDKKDDFNHPRLPIDHKLCRHVLFRKRSKVFFC